MCCLILSSSHCYRILLIWLKPSNTKISLVLRSPVLTTLLSPNRPMTTPILCLSFKFLASPPFFKLDWPTPSFRLLFSHVALSWSVLPISHFVRPSMLSLIQIQQTLLHSLRYIGETIFNIILTCSVLPVITHERSQLDFQEPLHHCTPTFPSKLPFFVDGPIKSQTSSLHFC